MKLFGKIMLVVSAVMVLVSLVSVAIDVLYYKYGRKYFEAE